MTAFRRIERKAHARANGATEVRGWTCEENRLASVKVQKHPESATLQGGLSLAFSETVFFLAARHETLRIWINRRRKALGT
jgi:hypothetical protein